MRKLLVCFLLTVVYQSMYAQLTIHQMLCEQMTNPVGISTSKPRFIWKISSPTPSTKQVAYELTVKKGKQKVWATGRVETDQSVFIQYNGQPLEQDAKYNWQVRVWDNHGNLSAWSPLASFQTAFFDSSAWKAKWISIGFEEDKKNRPAQYFRKNIQIKKEIAQATAYVTSQGMYQASINGKKIGDAYLTPGWTSYKKRLQYQVYDVSSLLRKGENALAAVIGNGWFRGTLGWSNNVDIYGKELGLLMQVNVVYSDGSK
jgi:alpha-L-rhamnosidase